MSQDRFRRTAEPGAGSSPMQSSGIPFDRYHRKTQSDLATIEADLTEDTTVNAGVEYRKHARTGTIWGNWTLVFSDGRPTHFQRGFATGLD